MDTLLWILLWAAIGFAAGVAASRVAAGQAKKNSIAGTLRVDSSDPDEAPYLFLELAHNGMEKIQSRKTVTFQVNLDGYLPRK